MLLDQLFDHLGLGERDHVEVENAPHDLVAGRDPQLERGSRPPKKPARPKYKVQR